MTTGAELWALAGGQKHAIQWTHSTFLDAGIEEALKRLDFGWNYHDTVTGYWAGNERIRRENLEKPSTARSGPVFFGCNDAGFTLRYQGADFGRFGYPVEELMSEIARRPNEWFVVAGFSNTGGLWLELVRAASLSFRPNC